MLIQCTSLGHVADRLAKAKGRPELATWLAAGGQFEVWGCGRRGVKRVAVTGQDLAEETVVSPPRRTAAALAALMMANTGLLDDLAVCDSLLRTIANGGFGTQELAHNVFGD